ncbi:MAG: hypothetical protein LJE65_07510 [Desulfobacteraceae bacterium]|nr:hypothetical protein [Desulfobacteraceae bacterium]
MSLTHKVQKADAIIQATGGDEWRRLKEICTRIRRSENQLLAEAVPMMEQCIHHCKGLCCQNIYPDEIITFADNVLVLALHPNLKPAMSAAARHESLFTSSCVFLEGGKGPCMFPPDLRPERCLTTFCADETPIRREIQEVRRAFSHLHRFLIWRQPRLIKEWVWNVLPS